MVYLIVTGRGSDNIVIQYHPMLDNTMTDFLYKKSINTSNECLNFECSSGSMVVVFLKLSVKQ